jgi:hypothetical protein
MGCAAKPAVVPVEKLTFPVVLIYRDQKTLECSQTEFNSDAAELGLMGVQHYLFLPESEPLYVVDSSGRVCEMREIKGQHGGLWLMANPSGLMPIKFTLVERKETGTEAARQLLLSCKYLGRDVDRNATAKLRDAVAKATTVGEMIELIRDGVSASEGSTSESDSDGSPGNE